MSGPCSSTFCIDNNYYCCAYSKTSISVNKYMQKAGEYENDAGFLKHNYSQLNCSCYSYPSKPRFTVVTVFWLHIYGISKWLLMQLTHTHTATARVSPHVHSTCTNYVLYAYLYCIYALVGGAISIRDPYICAVHESTNRMLSSTGLLSVK